MTGRFLVSGLFLLLSACGATPATSSSSYTPSEPSEVDNEIVVKEEFEAVWNRMVRNLATSYFVVNNISKESRLINVSFSTTNTAEYIECGTVHRSYARSGARESLEYKYTENATYREGRGIDRSGFSAVVAAIDRKTDVEGRINIYVAPHESGATAVTVNARYVLNIRRSGTEYEINSISGESTVSGQVYPSTETVGFTTNQPNRNSDGVSCYSLGKLEREILDMAGAR